MRTHKIHDDYDRYEYEALCARFLGVALTGLAILSAALVAAALS
jgi:hypothetical protein